MQSLMPLLVLLVAVPSRLPAQPSIDGASADRWEPRLGWTQTPPTAHGVTGEGRALVFTAEGAGKELPWQITLRPEETSGEARYLLVRYRAAGLANPPGNYLLHGWEGTPGGLTFAYSDEIIADGEPHALGVDLFGLWPAGDVTQLGVKVIVGETGAARLTIEELRFADELPPDAQVSRTGAREPRSVTLDWRAMHPLRPEPGWTQRPAMDFSAELEGSAVTFTVRGVGKQMRWPLALPEPVDLAALPYFSVRYRAQGAVGRTTYAVWMGDDPGGQGQQAFIPLPAGDLVADGEWHTYTQQLSRRFTATQLAVGLDSDGDAAAMTLDSVTFSSTPARWPLAQVLPYETREGAWPAGRESFTVLPPATGPRPSPFLGQRLGLADWFGAREITVEGVPFTVAAEAGEVPQTGAAALTALTLAIASDAAEVYLLTAAAAPPTEPWGIDWQHPRAVDRLSVPEKVVCEIRYADGPPDFVLPLDAATGQWGLKRGLGVHVVHPDTARRPTELRLHDRMQTAAFAILGATALAAAPRVPEPSWEALAYPAPPAGALAALKGARFEAILDGATWSRDAVRTAPDAVAWSKSPLFEVEIAGETLPAEGWRPFQPPSVISAPGHRSIFLRHAEAGLRAQVTVNATERGSMVLQMSLANEGPEPVTATLRFPVLRGVRLGSVEDTWYLFGKRGGIINREPISLREPLGEPHPLQVDGFFNPTTGLALA
ncbi:MAG: hypothetical protein FJX74_22160, partial [Armatimonadetes bacterium]|nr:hypothetical protein [Armatimonadota bacterium]